MSEKDLEKRGFKFFKLLVPFITVTESKEFTSKSCLTDYLKLEPASHFKNAMMN